eukprot:TRINITY_DN17662_c0_g2_i1.p1 TRINITY_DN17662_c0_g2~~TRINITY_DN17662_c0_g2_i1.p1  ORF type:complete len:366 (+),score=82.18 TRINITY_DN17662_c0_g2_i1:86-1183(+)
MANIWAPISLVCLFFLMFGLTATVDPVSVTSQFHRVKPLAVGVLCQFVLFPLCSAATILGLGLEANIAVPLIITTSSPGGSFSNLWCSLANADLALSVSMTAVSTVLSVAMLPLNVFLYAELLLGSRGVPVPIRDMLPPLGVVVGAVLLGLAASTHYPKWRSHFNRVGAVAGLLLMGATAAKGAHGDGGGGDASSAGLAMLSLLSFRLCAAALLPCVLGLAITALLATCVTGISPPERTALGIETCFQNTSIALAIALQGGLDGRGLLVPLLYGASEVLVISLWAVVCWRAGYTYAPPSTPPLRALLGNFQPSSASCVAVSPACAQGAGAAVFDWDVEGRSAGGVSDSAGEVLQEERQGHIGAAV